LGLIGKSHHFLGLIANVENRAVEMHFVDMTGIRKVVFILRGISRRESADIQGLYGPITEELDEVPAMKLQNLPDFFAFLRLFRQNHDHEVTRKYVFHMLLEVFVLLIPLESSAQYAG